MSKDIDKRVAHLTYAREHASVDQHAWKISDAAVALVEGVADLARTTVSSKLATDWTSWMTSHGVVSGAVAAPLKHDVHPGVSVATGA